MTTIFFGVLAKLLERLNLAWGYPDLSRQIHAHKRITGKILRDKELLFVFFWACVSRDGGAMNTTYNYFNRLGEICSCEVQEKLFY
jgi:hypothetical protein